MSQFGFHQRPGLLRRWLARADTNTWLAWLFAAGLLAALFCLWFMWTRPTVVAWGDPVGVEYRIGAHYIVHEVEWSDDCVGTAWRRCSYEDYERIKEELGL